MYQSRNLIMTIMFIHTKNKLLNTGFYTTKRANKHV